MSLKAGIVGLPNVGKSTLFNAITKQNILAANYPFATIEPNVGPVIVPDKRVDFLTELYNPKRSIPTTFEFTDIAGLVKGASTGEGLGNKFLSHIREVDAIIEVVRCFVDPNITHVTGIINPVDDIDIINIELVLADLEVVNNRLGKCGNNLEYALKNLGSLKEDELRANDQLEEIKSILKKAKYKISSYKIPVIPRRYYIELSEASVAIKNVVIELEKKPISIKTLNIRVDTARDLVLKLYNTSNEIIRTAQLAETSIVYGNRYRSVNKGIDDALTNSERFFNNGEYKNSLEYTINAINKVEPDFYQKLKETLENK